MARFYNLILTMPWKQLESLRMNKARLLDISLSKLLQEHRTTLKNLSLRSCYSGEHALQRYYHVMPDDLSRQMLTMIKNDMCLENFEICNGDTWRQSETTYDQDWDSLIGKGDVILFWKIFQRILCQGQSVWKSLLYKTDHGL